MRVNSPDKFPASSGYFGCQDMTTKADGHPKARAMASWHAQTEGSPGSAFHPFPWAVHYFSYNVFPLIVERSFSHWLPGAGQQVISNCGFGCIKMIREPRLKDDGQTKGNTESHLEKNPILIQGCFVPKHCKNHPS